MAEKLLKLKQQIASLQLVPSSDGCFEVSVNGRTIHSKLATGKYPDPEAILQVLRGLVWVIELGPTSADIAFVAFIALISHCECQY